MNFKDKFHSHEEKCLPHLHPPDKALYRSSHTLMNCRHGRWQRRGRGRISFAKRIIFTLLSFHFYRHAKIRGERSTDQSSRRITGPGMYLTRSVRSSAKRSICSSSSTTVIGMQKLIDSRGDHKSTVTCVHCQLTIFPESSYSHPSFPARWSRVLSIIENRQAAMEKTFTSPDQFQFNRSFFICYRAVSRFHH